MASGGMWIRYLFPLLLPLVVRWARGREAEILDDGFPLDEQGLRDAAAVGVAHPEHIRILLVDSVPGPMNRVLQKVGDLSGLLSEHTAGMSLRYGILIRKDCYPGSALVAHECTHTGQYERLGGFHGFLRQYLGECVELGYSNSPLEQEAVDQAARLYG